MTGRVGPWPPPPLAPGAAHLAWELDVRSGPVLQQQPHPLHVPGLDGEEEDLHGHAAQVGVGAAVQQKGDGRPPAPVSGRSRETVTGWRRGTRGPQPRHAPGWKETPPRVLARPDAEHTVPRVLPHQDCSPSLLQGSPPRAGQPGQAQVQLRPCPTSALVLT